jgi:DCN1-like protein 3
MGKCFSCEEPNHPAQNGQPRTSESVRTTQSYHRASQQSTHVLDTKTTSHSASVEQIDSEKRSSYQYPKLPPIRKSSGDSKRLSLTLRDYSESKINSLFEQYKEPDEDVILAEGVESFCCDLDVNPDDFRILVLAWKFQADTMCRFTRPQFISGCKALKVDSIKGIQSKFPEMILEVQNKEAFKDLYRWTYKFGLDIESGQRTLPADLARDLWELVFSQTEPQILKRWIFFLEQHPCIRGVPKDTWDMFLNFTEVVGDDLTTYDDTEAWPSLFDDFVEYENDRQNQNIEPSKE